MPIRLQGKEYVTHVELVEWATAAGLKSVETTIVHWSANPPEAIVKATATGERGTYAGIGDAFPAIRGNLGKMIAPHWLRMAETRAINRALRLYTGRATCSIDELGGGGNDQHRAPRKERPEDQFEAVKRGAPTLGDVQGEVNEVGRARSWSVQQMDTAVRSLGLGDSVAAIWDDRDALGNLLDALDNKE